MERRKTMHMVLGGGGVKGIAYIGVFEAAENHGIQLGNLAGVSAGALSGVIAAAGYAAAEQKGILKGLDFGKLDPGKIPDKIPVVARYMAFQNQLRGPQGAGAEAFIRRELYSGGFTRSWSPAGGVGTRGNFFKNFIKICSEGSLFDGDYLEEWVSKVLLKKGIRTFGDLRGGIPDRLNPRGYRIRMTAVDADRGRMITLPDDMNDYGIRPDDMEVAKAVRMSTCVPFAFKPVEVHKHHFVDGGVFDNLPYWLVNQPSPFPVVAFRFKAGEKKKLLSVDTSLEILKFFLSCVQDIGIPKRPPKLKNVVDIDTSKVSALNFDLTEADKEYLYSAGKEAAERFFQNRSMGNLQKFLFFKR